MGPNHDLHMSDSASPKYKFAAIPYRFTGGLRMLFCGERRSCDGALLEAVEETSGLRCLVAVFPAPTLPRRSRAVSSTRMHVVLQEFDARFLSFA